MASSTTTTIPTTTPVPTTTTTPAPVVPPPVAAAGIDRFTAASEPRKARLLPPGPWTRAATAEGLTANELLAIRTVVEPHTDSLLLWARNDLPPEGVDADGFRAAWGATIPLTDNQIPVVMRALAEHAGGEFVPGEAV